MLYLCLRVEQFSIVSGELLESVFVYVIELVKAVKISGGIIMKRMALIIIAFAFALTGCASVEAEKEAVSSPTETIVPIDNPQAPTTEADNGTAENITGIFNALSQLEYQPYTCDGLPEYLLTATDGTVYSINLSEKWVWRGNNEQAELSEELISQLENNAVKSLGMESAEFPIEPISQTEAEKLALAECKVDYDYIDTEFDAAQNAWEIGFWEDNTVIAAQMIVVDGAGNILNNWYDE